jgi:hypothetical protein
MVRIAPPEPYSPFKRRFSAETQPARLGAARDEQPDRARASVTDPRFTFFSHYCLGFKHKCTLCTLYFFCLILVQHLLVYVQFSFSVILRTKLLLFFCYMEIRFKHQKPVPSNALSSAMHLSFDTFSMAIYRYSLE